MRTVRLGALIGVAVVSTGFGLAATNCASATMITLEVRTRSELCTEGELRLNETGVAVTIEGKVNKPEKSPLQLVQKGCNNKGTGSIGTLVITPSGDKNAEVAIRVVASLNDNSANDCDTEDGKAAKNCIVAKRITRFREGVNVPVTIIIEPECNGVQCPDNLVCVKGGSCAPITAIPTDPEEKPDADAIQDATGVSETEPPKKDADPPIDPDAGPCSLCVGTGRSCTPADGKCTINCSVGGSGCDTNVCPNDSRLECVILCNKKDGCRDTSCLGAARKCTFECTGVEGPSHCQRIACDAGSCNVKCADFATTCDDVTMAGANNDMTCAPTADNAPSCNNVKCLGGTCKRTCGANDNDAGCGLAATCTGNCGAFKINDGGPPPEPPPPPP